MDRKVLKDYDLNSLMKRVIELEKRGWEACHRVQSHYDFYADNTQKVYVITMKQTEGEEKMNKQTYLEMRKEALKKYDHNEMSDKELMTTLMNLTRVHKQRNGIEVEEDVIIPSRAPEVTELTKKQVAKYKELKSTGLTDKVIAKNLGIAHGTLLSKKSTWKTQGLLKFTAALPKWKQIANCKEKFQQFAEWTESGVQRKVIREKWGISQTTLWNVINHWKEKGMLGELK